MDVDEGKDLETEAEDNEMNGGGDQQLDGINTVDFTITAPGNNVIRLQGVDQRYVCASHFLASMSSHTHTHTHTHTLESNTAIPARPPTPLRKK